MSTVGFELRDEPTPVRRLVADVWSHRTLLAVLARKDFHVRYRKAGLGMLWAIGLPILQAVVLAVVFERFVGDDLPDYGAFVLAGVLPWTFVSGTLPTAATSIVDGSDLSTRIYFPRSLFPLVTVAANLYGLALGLFVLLAGVALYGVPLDAHVLLLVPAVALAIAFTTALSLLLAALHVHFRDVRYVLQAALLAWFYVTPVIYPLDKAGSLAPWLRVNPVTGIVELFREATVGAAPQLLTSIAWTAGWTVVLAVGAALLYRRYERLFADLL